MLYGLTRSGLAKPVAQAHVLMQKAVRSDGGSVVSRENSWAQSDKDRSDVTVSEMQGLTPPG